MTLKEFLKLASTDYPSVSKDDVALLLSAQLGIPKLELSLAENRELTKSELAKIDLMLFQRAENEPIQYILGEAHFRNLILEVGHGVLIPRPETEILVDLALSAIAGLAEPQVCDLGTGSGAIALSIASEAENSSVIGIDISRDALKYAERNKLKNKIGNADFLYGDLLSPFEQQCDPRKFNLITANLPYVSQPLYDQLDEEVKNYEPATALVSGEDGLDLIRTASKKALHHLYLGGQIIFEFSPEQKDAISNLMRESGYKNVRIEKDLTDRDRFAIGEA